MPHNDDLDWATLTRTSGNTAKQTIIQLEAGLREYNEWQSFRAGRDNAAIATALGKTETQVADVDAAHAASKALYDYADNQTPVQSDYLFSLRKLA